MSRHGKEGDQRISDDEPLAGDVMRTDVVTVNPETTVQELARLFHEHDISGCPVVDADGRLVGIVTEGDLIEQDADLHFPRTFAFLDGVVFLDSQKKFEERLRKAIGSSVKDVMTKDVMTVTTETPVRKAATMMADKRINRIPVVYEGKVVGILGRNEVLAAIGL